MRQWKISATLAAVGYTCWCLCLTENRQLTLGEWRPGGIVYLNKKKRFALHPVARKGFGPQQCNRDGVQPFPTGPEQWQQNAPNFLIAGVPKAGTTTVSSLLKSHPTIFPPFTKELNLFRHLPIENNVTVSVRRAREYLYDTGGYRIKSLKKHPHALSYDGTPSYFFYSSTLMPLIMCVCPWIKIIVVLRDPVERFYSSFSYEIQRRTLSINASVAHIVDQEMNLMRIAGLNSTAQVPGSKEELLAWHRYQSLTHRGWVGKGVYDIPLRSLYQTMRDFGKPKSDLLVLTTANLRDDIFGSYARILKFLNLHHAPISSTSPRNSGRNRRPLHPDIRRRLEAFYGPYNARLNALLKDSGIAFDTYDQPTTSGNSTTATE